MEATRCPCLSAISSLVLWVIQWFICGLFQCILWTFESEGGAKCRTLSELSAVFVETGFVLLGEAAEIGDWLCHERFACASKAFSLLIRISVIFTQMPGPLTLVSVSVVLMLQLLSVKEDTTCVAGSFTISFHHFSPLGKLLSKLRLLLMHVLNNIMSDENKNKKQNCQFWN